jgi:hypothetical protein
MFRHSRSRRTPGPNGRPWSGLPHRPRSVAILPAELRRKAVDIYHVWCDLKPGVADITFAGQVAAYMDHLKNEGLIAGWRLTRRKLGLGAQGLGEFHVMMEVRDLAQLDDAFRHVASRREPVEGLHFGVNGLVRNTSFALYRDFPDPVRQQGEERF